jgi:hypothetical protein
VTGIVELGNVVILEIIRAGLGEREFTSAVLVLAVLRHIGHIGVLPDALEVGSAVRHAGDGGRIGLGVYGNSSENAENSNEQERFLHGNLFVMISPMLPPRESAACGNCTPARSPAAALKDGPYKITY